MKYALMGMAMVLSLAGAQAAPPEPERPRPAQMERAGEAVPARGIQPQTSSARKAEITRRMFWLALSLR